jgi:hypothetical protein
MGDIKLQMDGSGELKRLAADGTLIEAWAGQKSFKNKGARSGDSSGDPGNPTVDFKAEKGTNDTHHRSCQAPPYDSGNLSTWTIFLLSNGIITQNVDA